MIKNKSLLLFVFLTMLFGGLRAQIDTEFWFAAPDITAGHDHHPILLCFASFGQPADVTVTQPANPSFQPITVHLNSFDFYSLDMTSYESILETAPENTVTNYGLKVVSTNRIATYYQLCDPNSEIYTLKGRNALGTHFIVPMQNTVQLGYYSPEPRSSIEIVATQDNTTVTIIPGNAISGSTADTIVVVLNAGQTYSIRSVDIQASSHLGNTFIYADKPVAVNSTDDSVYHSGSGAADLSADQIVPVDYAGNLFVSIWAEQSYDYETATIFPTQDSTQIFIDGSTTPVATINVGQQYVYHHSVNMSSPITMIRTDKPVLVWQLSGYLSEMGATQLPALECTGSQEVVYGRSNYSTTIVAYIITKTANISNFTVQCSNSSATLNATDFTPLPYDNTLSYCLKDFSSDVNNGSVMRVSNSSGKFHLGVLDYGNGTTSLGYFCAYNNGGRLVFTQDEQHCPHSNFALTYFADDADSIQFITPTGTVLLQDSLIISDFTPADTGLYYIRARSTMACDSLVWISDSIRLSLYPEVDTTHVYIAECESYTWNGVTYDSTGVYVQTLANTTGCDSVVVLHLTVIPLPQLTHTPDTVLVPGDSATLWASGADILYWTDANGNILSSTPYLTVSPAIPTMYYIVGQNFSSAIGNNLVVNGDFEGGNVDFYCEYSYVTGYNNMFFGSYSITTDGILIWGTDHLYGYGGTGQFMVVDGSTTPNSIVWQQTVPVTPNTYYAFSAQVASTLNSNSSNSWALLQFSVNGTQLGPVFHSPNVLNTWQPYYEVWYSGNNTSATLTILNQNTDGGGNDFGLDEIVFAPLSECIAMDSVFVIVNTYPDNVDSAECTFLPEGTEWGVHVDWSSSSIVSNLNSPLVGDLDNDGHPDVLCFSLNGQVSNTEHWGQGNLDYEMLVFDGVTKQLKTTITMQSPVSAYDAASYGLVRTSDGKGLIVTANYDYKLRAYDITSSSPSTPYWVSDINYGADPEEFAVNVSFVDFNGDGHPEVYVRNKVYNAENGKLLLVVPTSNTGSSYAHYTHNTHRKLSAPMTADLSGNSHPDLILGNEIYEINITNPNGTEGNTATLWRQITPPTPVPVDGHTQVADFNLDSHLDVFISIRNTDGNSGTVYCYVWDVFNNTVSQPLSINTSFSGKSIPLIADIDNDGSLEMVIQCAVANSTNKVQAYKYNAASGTFSMIWDMHPDEDSYSNSFTAFDFNLDGLLELIICDQSTLRIVNGSGKSHLTHNDTVPVYVLNSFPFSETTIMQYPVIADADADGSAEIVSVGSSKLNFLKSTGQPWAPARPVWNQYMYNVTNVNKDLTIPPYLFNNATPFTDPEGVVRLPFNNFLQQATSIDQFGRPFYAVPDVAASPAASSQITGDSLILTFSYCNLGDNSLNAPYPVSVFLNTYGGDILYSTLVHNDLPADSCTQREIHLPLNALCGMQNVDAFVIAVNCAGNGIAQNGNLQPECDTTNNTAFVTVNIVPQTDTVSIEVHACDTLTWNGVIYNTSGVYMQTLENMYGCDSVVVMSLTVDPSSLTVFSDSICQYSEYNGYGFSLSEDETSVSGLNTIDRTLSNQFGCDSVIRLNLYVKPVVTPIFYADPDKALLSENPVIHFVNNTNIVEISQTNYYWIWDFGDGTSDTTFEAETSHLYSQWGDYTVTLTLWADGCSAYDTILVFIEADLVFPNVITPNGDGVNDVFAIKDLNPERPNRLYITDRWGKTVWDQKNYQTYMKDEQIYNAESGFGTKDISDGVYYYTFYYEGLVRTIKFNGSITVIRQ